MIIKLFGNPYDQGKMHGEACPDLIKDNIKEYRNKINKYAINKTYYKKLVYENLKYLEDVEPDIVEEMHGIAEGSGLDFKDILIINIPLYFLLDRMPEECSSILAMGHATLDKKTYLVKNRDNRDKIKHVILERFYDNGNKIVEVGCAGIITGPGNGLNKYGLAISTSGVWPKNTTPNLNISGKSHILLNINLLLKYCSTVDEAIKYLKNSSRMNGMNFIISDKHNAAAVEVSDDDIAVEKSKSGLLARTNHYTTDKMKHLNPSYLEYPSTYKRYDRIMNYLNKECGKIRFQEMLQIASDHENSPECCICRHGYGNDANTLYSSIIVINDFQVWTSLGNPCESLKLSKI